MTVKKKTVVIDKLIFKHESDSDGTIIGPLWKVVGGKRCNYQDSRMKRWDNGFYPEWFTLGDAMAIARRLRVRLEVG